MLWHEPGPQATMLHLACCCIQPAMVEWLLENGADMDVELFGLATVDLIDAFGLFSSTRALKPQEAQQIRDMLAAAKNKKRM